MRRLVFIAMLVGSIGCSSSTPLALTPDGSSPVDSGPRDIAPDTTDASDATDATGAADTSDANPCRPYSGGAGYISESRLPAGACAAPASCRINTWDVCPQKQWQCTCEAGNWSCTLLGVGKVDCGLVDAGAIGAPTTTPDAPYCCPRSTIIQGCMRLGGVNMGCGFTCDFWCSTNWRVEIDQYGCEFWARDYRKPAPGEDAQCLPASDAGE